MEYFSAVEYGDVIAQDEDVGAKAGCFFDGLFAVYGFAYDAYPVTVFECTSDADAKKRCGIGYDDVGLRFSHGLLLVCEIGLFSYSLFVQKFLVINKISGHK